MRGEYFLSALVNRIGRGITPACAGNTHYQPVNLHPIRDHPRLRGEYQTFSLKENQYLGSPPLARGIPTANMKSITAERITPACAGNTSQIGCILVVNQDHPRLRGEYRISSRHSNLCTGSPPLARGILPRH